MVVAKAAGEGDLELSIVVPAYNEAHRIAPTLDRLLAWLEEEGLSGEILVVDDGSTDGTAALVRRRAEDAPALSLLSYGQNRGKGYAVGWGIANARGRQILFCDADLSTPIEEYFVLARALEGADIAIGSRAKSNQGRERSQPLYRRAMGRTFSTIVKAVAVQGYGDTQCGFKLFRGEAAKRCFALRKIDGFAFDVEILHIAGKLGFAVAEVPVSWHHCDASTIDPVKHSLQMFRDLLRVRWLHRGL